MKSPIVFTDYHVKVFETILFYELVLALQTRDSKHLINCNYKHSLNSLVKTVIKT